MDQQMWSKMMHFPLHQAASVDDVQTIEQIVSVQPNVNVLDADGASPLHIAAQFGAERAVHLLLQLGADPTLNYPNYPTVLHVAAYFGHVGIVRAISNVQFNLDLQDHMGNTPLHLAVIRGNVDAAQRIIKAGASIEVTNAVMHTPLDEARLTNNSELLKAFREQALLRRVDGARVKDSASQAQPMRHLGERTSVASEHSGDISLDGGAMQIEYGATSLLDAVTQQDAQAVKWALERGESTSSRGPRGESPLHVAAFHGGADVLEALVARGADVSSHDCDASTPLHAAAAMGQISAAQLLLDKGANMVSRTHDGMTAADLVLKARFRQVVELLNARLEALNNGTDQGRFMELCAERGVDVDSRSPHGGTMAHFLVECGANELLDAYCQAYPLSEEVNDRSELPIHMAIAGENVEAVKILVAAGSPMNVMDASGDAPIHLACFIGNSEIVRHLIAANPDLNVLNTAGDTPLHIAAAERHVDIISLLMQAGVDTSIKNADHFTPVEWADDDLADLFG